MNAAGKLGNQRSQRIECVDRGCKREEGNIMFWKGTQENTLGYFNMMYAGFPISFCESVTFIDTLNIFRIASWPFG